MKPFWHPLSAVLLVDPPCFATPHLLRMLLGSDAGLEVAYGGDRMWPTVRHGQRVRLSTEPRSLEPGDVVVACPGGVPELWRVVTARGTDLAVIADADPEPPQTIDPSTVLAVADLPRALPDAGRRTARRLALDLREAVGAALPATDDPAVTVHHKYESQAPYYARAKGEDLDPNLLERIRGAVPAGGSILVVGSGAGRECFALRAAGWSICGVDFAPAMVEASRTEAIRRGLDVEFRVADVRSLDLEAASLDGVLFTYDVYSFLPRQSERVATLRQIRRWLRPRGATFLSARRARTTYERTIVTLQFLAASRRGPVSWGGSHTRWIGLDGTVHRAFVQLFTEPMLRAELAEAGFRAGPKHGGHWRLDPVGAR